MVRGFYHHADKGFCAGLPHQNTTDITQCFCNSLDCLLYRRVVLCSFLVGHTDILQHLRIDFQRLSQLAHGHLLGQHNFHHLQASQDAITGACVLGENDMTTLLTANTAAVLCHVLIDVLVAHSGLSITNALLIESLVQTKVGHDSRDHGVVHQLAVLLHVAAVDVQDMVASDNITLLVHTQAAVSIAIESKPNIQPILHHKPLQPLNMGRTSVIVDVQAVWLIIDDVGICAQSIKHTLCNIPARTVGAIQTDLNALEGVDTQRDQVAHVTIASCHIVHSAADVLTLDKGQLRPILIEHMELAIDVVLYQQQSLLGHFLTVAVNQLDAIIVVGVMACGDHDAAVEVVHASDISHRRRSSDVQQPRIPCNDVFSKCWIVESNPVGA